MTSAKLIRTFYDPELFPLTFIEDKSQISETDLKLKNFIINYFREDCDKLDIDVTRFTETFKKILTSYDDLLITRAVLLIFMLKNIIDISPFIPMILHRYNFNKSFYNELKNSRSLMLDVIESIHDFIKNHTFEDDALYPLINDIILANEDSPNPVSIKNMKFIESNEIDKKLEEKIKKEFPLILPFDLKCKEYAQKEVIATNSVFPVNRNDILSTVWTFNYLTDYNIKLSINFADEDETDDKGDLTKEFIDLAFEQVMKPETDLFDLRHGCYWFKYHKFMTNELLKHYQCVGTLFGLSILNNMPIPIHFPRYLYKKLLNKPIVLADLALFNPVLYASLRAIQNGSVPINPSVDFIYIDDLANYLIDLTNFCDTTDDKDFIPKPVTDENKKEFIENLLTWVFEKSCSQAFHAFEEGIKKVNTNQMLFTNFSCGEIDEIISGNAPFNWDDLKKGAKYSEPYDANNKVISWFWKYFEQLDEDQKLNVLKFITGSTSIPKGGLKDIHITFNPSDSEIPKADSDQQEIQLPQYRTYDELVEKCNESVNHE